jgi:hypothetical protein
MTRYATIIPPVKRIEVELVHLLKEFKLAEKPDSSHLSPTHSRPPRPILRNYIEIISIAFVDVLTELRRSFLLLGYGALFLFFTEIATMLTNRKRRSLHDFIAGSVVVKLYNQPMERAA